MVRIIITGHPSIENAAKSVNEKADGYIMKPFNVSELLRMINKLIEEKSNSYLKMFAEVEQEKKEYSRFRVSKPK